jgi:hypothetical protein
MPTIEFQPTETSGKEVFTGTDYKELTEKLAHAHVHGSRKIAIQAEQLELLLDVCERLVAQSRLSSAEVQKLLESLKT